jgi:hypothetical protein
MSGRDAHVVVPCPWCGARTVAPRAATVTCYDCRAAIPVDRAARLVVAHDSVQDTPPPSRAAHFVTALIMLVILVGNFAVGVVTLLLGYDIRVPQMVVVGGAVLVFVVAMAIRGTSGGR